MKLKLICLILAFTLVLSGCYGLTGEGDLTSAQPSHGTAGDLIDESLPSQTTQNETTHKDVTSFEPTVSERPSSDPYENVSKSEFYANYTEAQSYWDSYYRTQHGFMSGSIDPQDQEAELSQYRPSKDGVLLFNTDSYYFEDGKAYAVVNAYGEVVNTVYECGAYVSLEDVAAYVFAFGDIPANYISKKSGSPSSSIWGEYLRLNNSSFTGNTSKYPYEPELPDISGCGGDLRYYEIDIGTTGTDCDPSYTSAVYNNGSRITRGAARIVYARFDGNGNKIIDVNEKYVFYTNNHYNDFRQYLNYEGGWGDIFGNITGGGKISSKTDYNPTPYIPVLNSSFSTGTYQASAPAYTLVIFCDPYGERRRLNCA